MRRLKKRVAAVLVAAMMLSAPITAAAWENPYVDVPQGTWYYDAVEYVATEGLFAGTGSDTFSPNAPMTRAMAQPRVTYPPRLDLTSPLQVLTPSGHYSNLLDNMIAAVSRLAALLLEGHSPAAVEGVLD